MIFYKKNIELIARDYKLMESMDYFFLGEEAPKQDSFVVLNNIFLNELIAASLKNKRKVFLLWKLSELPVRPTAHILIGEEYIFINESMKSNIQKINIPLCSFFELNNILKDNLSKFIKYK